MIPDGSTTGSAVQLGAAISYADTQRRFAVGPEALLSTVVSNGNAFKRDYTSLNIHTKAEPQNIVPQSPRSARNSTRILSERCFGTPQRAPRRLGWSG
jgi:hypothetical protein